MGWRPTRAQFFTLGLPPESCTALPRTLAAVDVGASSFELVGHGLEDGDHIRFRAEGDGGTLPAPLSATVLYEAAPVGDSLFQVRALGGALVTLTDAGTGVITVTADYAAKLDSILEHFARWVDDHAIPYGAPDKGVSPFENATVPPSFVLCACQLAALCVATTLRAAAPSYSIDDVRTAATAAQVFLDKMRDGKPLAVPPVDKTPELAEVGARAFKRRPSRGFGREEL